MSKIKKLLTLEDLVKFCKEQEFSNFSSKETGYQLSVQVPATFEVENAKYQDDTLLFGKVKLFHVGPNRNGSSVTKKTTILVSNISGIADLKRDEMSSKMKKATDLFEKGQKIKFLNEEEFLNYNKNQTS